MPNRIIESVSMIRLNINYRECLVTHEQWVRACEVMDYICQSACTFNVPKEDVIRAVWNATAVSREKAEIMVEAFLGSGSD